MHSDRKRFGKSLLLSLFLAGMTLNLGGCISMQLTNAQFWAEKAAEIAADCPAGEAAAQAAAQAAENARNADQRYQQASQEAAALSQELVSAQADFEYYQRRAEELQHRIDSVEEFSADEVERLRYEASVCAMRARELRTDEEDWDPDWNPIAVTMGDVCFCGERECEEYSSAREQENRLWDQARRIEADRDAIEQDRQRLASIRNEMAAKDERVRQLTIWIRTKTNTATAALTELRQAEEEAHRQMENAADLCDDNLLTGPTLPPSATDLYDQDIYGAQSQGLPGTPPPPPPAGTCELDGPMYMMCIGGAIIDTCPSSACSTCRAAGCF